MMGRVSDMLSAVSLQPGEYAIVFALGCFALVLFSAPVWGRRNEFERVGKSWLVSFLSGKNAMSFTIEKHVQKGYEQVIKKTDQPFMMKWWALDNYFLPPKYLPDLKHAEAGALSFFHNISDAFSLYASVNDLYSSDLMVEVVKKGINTRLPSLIPLLNEECDEAFRKEMGGTNEWNAYPATSLFSKIMLQTTSRVLIGPELCRDQAYLDTTQTVTDSIFINGLVMSMLPLGVLRRPISYLLSIFHRRNIRKSMNVILPVVQKRFDEFQRREPSVSTDKAVHQDAIEWSLEYSKDSRKEHDPHWISLSLIHNLWAGSAAAAGVVTQMVFQVLMEPAYLAPLRAEAEEATRTYGWTDKALSSMPLQDSFIREMNRLYPTGAVTCARTVMDPDGFQFHDGMKLPQGARIAMPAGAIQMDPDNFENPLTFEGFRFAKLASASKLESREEGERKWNATTVSDTNLAFGFGKHSCAGRFYAVRKIKLLFSKFILQYDLKWDNSGQRPPSLSVNGQFAPNQSQKIYLKKIV